MQTFSFGASFNDIKGFRDHFVAKFEWGPSLMLDEREAQVRYFKNPDHESHVNTDQRETDVAVFHGIIKISMNTSTIVMWMRSMGYLVDYNSIDFKNSKGLYLNCAALNHSPYTPNVVTDVTEKDRGLSLSESASSTMSAM